MTYFRTFLLNDTLNTEGWRIPFDVIRTSMNSWIGTYGILYEDCSDTCHYDHNDGNTLEEALAKSKDEKVTQIVDVELNGNTLYAIHKVLDPDFEEVLCNEIFSVSASIWLTGNSKRDPVTSYAPVHLAFLNIKGGYGKPAENIEKEKICKFNNLDVVIPVMEEPTKDAPKQEEANDELDDHQMLKAVYDNMMKAAETKEEEEEPTKEEPKQASASSKKKRFDWVKPQVAAEVFVDELAY